MQTSYTPGAHALALAWRYYGLIRRTTYALDDRFLPDMFQFQLKRAWKETKDIVAREKVIREGWLLDQKLKEAARERLRAMEPMALSAYRSRLNDEQQVLEYSDVTHTHKNLCRDLDIQAELQRIGEVMDERLKA